MTFCKGCFDSYDSKLDLCPHCSYYHGEEKESNSYLDVGIKLQERYIIGTVIGRGGFGVTYYAWDNKLQQRLAIKEYLPSEFSTRMQGNNNVVVFKGEKQEQFNIGLKKFVEEANKLLGFRSTDGVVEIKESFFEFGTAYIVMEYLDGETMGEYLKKNPKTSAQKTIDMIMPIIQSLKIIHSKGIIHRDISPDNIIITKSGKAKLIDFGASRYATTTKTRSMSVITKAGYSPEEQYSNAGDQGPHTDVYALAATMYHMITGVKPPISIERNAHYKEKKKDLLVPIVKLNGEIGENQEIAISNALNITIEQRTTDMKTFEDELTSKTPIKRRDGIIKATDLLTWPLWLKATVGAAASFIVVLIALFSFGIIEFDTNLETETVIAQGLTRVPLIVSDDSQEAEEKLVNASLNYQIIGKSYSELIPENYILSQDLTAGSLVDINSVISVVISAGNSEMLEYTDANGFYTLADVTFLDQELAIQNLETQEMIVTITEEYSDAVAAGLVVSQSIEAGTLLEAGNEITIVVSLGSEGFAVPSFIGLSEEEAKEMITELGLVISIGYVNSSDYADGTIISQDIEENTMVTIGSTIAIEVVSNTELEVVPNVIGMSESEAKAALEALGFEVQVNIPDATQINLTITSQSPSSGVSVAKGSLVTLNMTGTTVTTTTSTASTTSTATASTSSFTITFNANGGSVSKSSMTATVNTAYGTLPTPTRDYYTFDGWYTSATGGTLVSSTSKNTSATNITLYAHWTQNSTSGWVLASSVPSSAQIVNTKWTYDLTSYTTSTASSLSGWTLYDSAYAWSDYGSWSSWSTTVYTSSDSRKIETQSVKTDEGYYLYRYGRYYSSVANHALFHDCSYAELYGSSSYYSWQWTSWSTTSYTKLSGVEWTCSKCGTFYSYVINGTTYYVMESQYVEATYETQYRYADRTKVYTYYYSKVTSSESTVYPSSSDASNIVEYVQYRAK